MSHAGDIDASVVGWQCHSAATLRKLAEGLRHKQGTSRPASAQGGWKPWASSAAQHHAVIFRRMWKAALPGPYLPQPRLSVWGHPAPILFVAPRASLPCSSAENGHHRHTLQCLFLLTVGFPVGEEGLCPLLSGHPRSGTQKPAPGTGVPCSAQHPLSISFLREEAK